MVLAGKCGGSIDFICGAEKPTQTPILPNRTLVHRAGPCVNLVVGDCSTFVATTVGRAGLDCLPSATKRRCQMMEAAARSSRNIESENETSSAVLLERPSDVSGSCPLSFCSSNPESVVW